MMKPRIIGGFLAIVLLWPVCRTADLRAEKSDIEGARAHKIVAVWNFSDPDQAKDAYELGLDVIEFAQGRSITFVTDAETLADLLARGDDIAIENPDIIEFYSSRLKSAAMGGYRTLGEIVLAMDSLHEMNPAISTARYSIGQTIEGREIWVMKISDNPDSDEDEPESLINAAIHAREVITPEITLEVMRRLIQGYGIDTFLTRLVDTREIFFMPCFNMDGYQYNQEIAPDGGGMWRKNRRINGDGSQGVDLNRNFTYRWGFNDAGSSPIPLSETYRGTEPASEPEVQAYIDFVESHEFVVSVDLHSHGNRIIWPYGYDYEVYTPEEALFEAMGESMSEFNGYSPSAIWKFYLVNGSTVDWCYGKQTTKSKIYSFAFEVGNSVDGFWPSISRIPELVNENIPPLLYLIDISANPLAAAPPLAPTWTTSDTFPTGFFQIDWSQPENGNEVASFDLFELLDRQTGTDGAESGTDQWEMDGFRLHNGIKYEGIYAFYSASGDNIQHTMTTRYPLAVAPGDSLTFYAWYDIERYYDYAYVEVSTESQSGFVPIPGNITSDYNPYGRNRGNGITGSSGWIRAKFDLSAYAGQEIYLRLSYFTNYAYTETGFLADLITPVPWFNQTTARAEDYTDSIFAIGGRPMGKYYFKVSSTDAEGQTSAQSVIKIVRVLSDILYGDLNNDSGINPVDVVWLANLVYRSGPPPVVWGAQYIDGNNACNPVDVVWLVNHVYRQGPPPVGYGE